MSSNCFIVYDDETRRAVVIDPGSEKSEKEISFLANNHLRLDYILLTHEHTDHNWGVNALKEAYPDTKLVCSELCDQLVKKTNRTFFSFYYDDPNYVYVIDSADILIKSNDDVLPWDGKNIRFMITPGHSKASMCIDIEGRLFTGDTIMPYPRYLNRKDGNEEEWRNSVRIILSQYGAETEVFPGHGECLLLKEWNIESNIKLFKRTKVIGGLPMVNI